MYAYNHTHMHARIQRCICVYLYSYLNVLHKNLTSAATFFLITAIALSTHFIATAYPWASEMRMLLLQHALVHTRTMSNSVRPGEAPDNQPPRGVLLPVSPH